jgi:hypothetical protein
MYTFLYSYGAGPSSFFSIVADLLAFNSSFEQFLLELCTIILEQQLQSLLEILEKKCVPESSPRTDQSDSLIFKCGDCPGEGKCRSSSSSSTMTEQFHPCE